MHLRHFGRVFVLTLIILFIAAPSLAIPTPAPLPPIIPNHVPTWAYDGPLGGQTDSTTHNTTNATSTARIQTWVSYADGAALSTGASFQKAGLDCLLFTPCKPIMYAKPFQEDTGGASVCHPDNDWYSLANLVGFVDETQFLHSATPISFVNRISTTNLACGTSTTRYYPNPFSAGNQAYWQGYYQGLGTGTVWGGISLDNCPGDLATEQTMTASTAAVEIPTQTTLEAAHSTFLQSLVWTNGQRIPIICNNGISPPSASKATLSYNILLDVVNLLGVICEGCASLGATNNIQPALVGNELGTISNFNALASPNAFYIDNGASTAAPGSNTACTSAGICASGQLQIRMWTTAIAWLSYNPNLTNIVIWPNMDPTTTTLNVYPEDEIVPLGPLETMTQNTALGNEANGGNSGCTTPSGTLDPNQVGGAISLAVNCGLNGQNSSGSGVYFREFGSCYNFGLLIGPCAVLLNTTNATFTLTAATTFLQSGAIAVNQTYGHYIDATHSLSGADVVTAGCGNARCPTSVINPAGTAFTLGTTTTPANTAQFLFP